SHSLRLLCPTHTHCYPFFSSGPATPEISTLSLHDALPISEPTLEGGNAAMKGYLLVRSEGKSYGLPVGRVLEVGDGQAVALPLGDRKSTRLNSSHRTISYAVFCLKKKITKTAEHKADYFVA